MYNFTSRSEVKTLMVTEGRDMIHMPVNHTESLVAIEGMVSVGEGAAKEERQEAAALATTNRYFIFSHNTTSYLSLLFVKLHK